MPDVKKNIYYHSIEQELCGLAGTLGELIVASSVLDSCPIIVWVSISRGIAGVSEERHLGSRQMKDREAVKYLLKVYKKWYQAKDKGDVLYYTIVDIYNMCLSA